MWFNFIKLLARTLLSLFIWTWYLIVSFWWTSQLRSLFGINVLFLVRWFIGMVHVKNYESVSKLFMQSLVFSALCRENLDFFHDMVYLYKDKKSELPQRWLCDAPSVWVPWKFLRVPEYTHSYFAEIFNGLLFRLILWMCVPNLKFVALPVSEIIGGTQKIWVVRGYTHAPFSPKFFMGFCLDGPCECIV